MFRRELFGAEQMRSTRDDVIEEVYTDEKWLGGIANNIQVSYINPGGPILRQCKVSLVRRPGNRIVARASMCCYLYEKDLDLILIVERFIDGSWEIEETSYVNSQFRRRISTYVDHKGLPGKFYRARAVCIVNELFLGMPQREMVYTKGIWNDWDRDDGCNEEEYVPRHAMYDKVPLPRMEDQEKFEEDRTTFYYLRRRYD